MDTIFEWLSELKPENIIVILTSIASLIVSIVVEIITSKRAKKLEKMRIDADLVAKARIEWIQNVRETASQFIASCYMVLNLTDAEQILSKVEEIKGKTSLLCLYFGPDISGENNDNIKIDLMNQENNIGKNEEIVKYITDLFDKIYNYYFDTKVGKLQFLSERVHSTLEDVRNNPIGQEYLGIISDSEGYEEDVYRPINDPELVAKAENARKELSDYVAKKDTIYKNIDTLRDYIRIYLKIEWNKAKEGK